MRFILKHIHLLLLLFKLSLENIGSDAKFYYYHSTTQLDELSSYRNSVEYELEDIDSSDYNDSSDIQHQLVLK